MTTKTIKTLKLAADVPDLFLFQEKDMWKLHLEGSDELFQFQAPQDILVGGAAFHCDKGSLLRVSIQSHGSSKCKALDLWLPHEGRPRLACFLDQCLPEYALVGLGPSKVVRLGEWVIQAVDANAEPGLQYNSGLRDGEGPELSLFPDIGWYEIQTGRSFCSHTLGKGSIQLQTYDEPRLAGTLILPAETTRLVAVLAESGL